MRIKKHEHCFAMWGFVFLVLMIPFGTVTAQDRSGNYLCTAELAVENPPNAPVNLGNFDLFAGDATYGILEIVNNNSKNIKFYLIILDVLDKSGKHLTSMPVFDTDEKDQIPFDVDFKPWLQSIEVPTEKSLHGKETWNWPTYSQLTFLTCPSAARVSMMWIRYSDGSEFKYLRSSLNIRSVLLRSDLGTNKLCRWEGLVVNGAITIDSLGHASLDHTDSAPLELHDLLEKEIPNWKFWAVPTVHGPALQMIPFVLVIGKTDIAHLRTELELVRNKGIEGPFLLLSSPPSSSQPSSLAKP